MIWTGTVYLEISNYLLYKIYICDYFKILKQELKKSSYSNRNYQTLHSSPLNYLCSSYLKLRLFKKKKNQI